MNVLRARGVQSGGAHPVHQFPSLFELLRPALPCMGQDPLARRPRRWRARSRSRPSQRAGPLRRRRRQIPLSLLAAYSEAAPVADAGGRRALAGRVERGCPAVRVPAALVADPVAVVLAVRQGEPSLLDGADLPTLRLHGLDRESAAELLRHQGDEPLSQELADRLHRETEAGTPSHS